MSFWEGEREKTRALLSGLFFQAETEVCGQRAEVKRQRDFLVDFPISLLPARSRINKSQSSRVQGHLQTRISLISNGHHAGGQEDQDEDHLSGYSGRHLFHVGGGGDGPLGGAESQGGAPQHYL